MGKFTVIPQDTFDGLQLDAGVLLNTFRFCGADHKPSKLI